jgi:hypothetical protein
MPGAGSPDPLYVAARRVLLDALEALGTHRKAVVLVGAQAIYLHVGEGDLAVSPFTTDGDLAIDPRELDDEPALVESLKNAGFELAIRPGTWSLSNVQIDLLVPASLGGPGRRGARLGRHGADVARKATGLEAAIVDNARFRIGALDPKTAERSTSRSPASRHGWSPSSTRSVSARRTRIGAKTKMGWTSCAYSGSPTRTISPTS